MADAQELERRAAFRNASYKIANKEGGDEEEEDDDDFGNFESANESNMDTVSNNMENVHISQPVSPPQQVTDDNHLVRAVKTKEEEAYLKQKKDYLQDEEQHGEI